MFCAGKRKLVLCTKIINVLIPLQSSAFFSPLKDTKDESADCVQALSIHRSMFVCVLHAKGLSAWGTMVYIPDLLAANLSLERHLSF